MHGCAQSILPCLSIGRSNCRMGTLKCCTGTDCLVGNNKQSDMWFGTLPVNSLMTTVSVLHHAAAGEVMQ